MKTLKSGGASVGSVESFSSFKDNIKKEVRNQFLNVEVNTCGITITTSGTSESTIIGNGNKTAFFHTTTEWHQGTDITIITNTITRGV